MLTAEDPSSDSIPTLELVPGVVPDKEPLINREGDAGHGSDHTLRPTAQTDKDKADKSKAQLHDHGGLSVKQVNDWTPICVDNEEVEPTNLRLLQLLDAQERKNIVPFIIPKIKPLDILFFRKIFTRMLNARKKTESENERKKAEAEGKPVLEEIGDALPPSGGEDEVVSISDFQRAFERLFYLLRDTQGFDAAQFDVDGNGCVGWHEFMSVYKNRSDPNKRVSVRSISGAEGGNGSLQVTLNLSERVFITFDDPDSSIVAQIVSFIVLVTIIVSSLTFICSTHYLFQTLPDDLSHPEPFEWLGTLELCCLGLFTGEYFIRFVTSISARTEVFDTESLLELTVDNQPIILPRMHQRLFNFVTHIPNLVDLIAILPGWIGMVTANDALGGLVVLRIVRLTRLFKVVKSLRAPALIIARTIQGSTKALYVLAFQLCLGIIIFGSLLWLAEGGTWNKDDLGYRRQTGQRWDGIEKKVVPEYDASPFVSIPHTFWWAIVTATTVGYGDTFPTTSMGYVIAVSLMMFSLVLMALPVGVVGDVFGTQWDSFEEEKKQKELRNQQDNYAVKDSVQRIDPEVLSKLIIVEVWNDRFPHASKLGKRDRSEFMGYAMFELDLGPDSKAIEKPVTCVLKLQADPRTVDRTKITGSVTLSYEWKPAAATHLLGEDMVQHGISRFVPFKGTLKVTLISAEKLVNLNMETLQSKSNPFCTIMCYPSSPLKEKCVVTPSCWRSKTAQNNLEPTWNSVLQIEFHWTGPQPQMEEEKHDAGLAAPQNNIQLTDNKGDKALGEIKDLANQLRELTKNVTNLQLNIDEWRSKQHS